MWTIENNIEREKTTLGKVRHMAWNNAQLTSMDRNASKLEKDAAYELWLIVGKGCELYRIFYENAPIMGSYAGV